MMGLSLEGAVRKVCPKAGEVTCKRRWKGSKTEHLFRYFHNFWPSDTGGNYITFAFPTDLYFMLQVSDFFLFNSFLEFLGFIL